MLIHELTAAECHEVLRRSHTGRVACCRDDHPYIVPISFDFDGEHLYSFATLGQKIVWMRANPNVCVEVSEIVDRFHWTTVLVFGRYEELREPVDHEPARQQAREYFEQRDEWWQPAAAKAGPVEHHVPIVYRVVPRKITGRRADRPVQP
jgi:nitroimidazol reductase NimA-like FMN-containing flavoprotein (pyridoxamine 5'-phosphate oxidase superfamily)